MEFIPEEGGRQERVKTSVQQLKLRVGEIRTNRREARVVHQYITPRPLIVGEDITWVNKWLSRPPALHISDNVNGSQQPEGETAHTHHIRQRPGKTERQQQHQGATKTAAQCKRGRENTESLSPVLQINHTPGSRASPTNRGTLCWTGRQHLQRILGTCPVEMCQPVMSLSAPKCNNV